jgi:hypothetical protein
MPLTPTCRNCEYLVKTKGANFYWYCTHDGDMRRIHRKGHHRPLWCPVDVYPTPFISTGTMIGEDGGEKVQ